MIGRLVALALTAVYLGLMWLQSETKRSLKQVVADCFHALSIAAAAIAIYENVSYKQYFVGAIMLIAALAHAFGLWFVEGSKDPKQTEKRISLSAIHVLGILLCVFIPQTYNLNIWAPMGFVLIGWLVVNKVYKTVNSDSV